MKITSNVHTHTTYCDGTASVDEMVQAAVKNGLTCIGFSGHSYINPEETYTMSLSGTDQYMKDVCMAKEKYAGQIQVLLGIEWDSMSQWRDYENFQGDQAPGTMKEPAQLGINRQQFDYMIGSVHSIQSPQTGISYAVDYLPETFQACIQEGFQGNWMAMAEAYYSQLVDLYDREKPTIVGHFDLLKKLNGKGSFFDEESAAYQEIAMAALEELVRRDAILEVNTGGINRGYRQDPYPSDFLLKRIRELKGRVLVSADAHDTEGICFLFEETGAQLRSLGFREAVQLTEQGLEGIIL